MAVKNMTQLATEKALVATEIEYKPVGRADGVMAHNLEFAEDEAYLYLRVSKTIAPVPSKNGKPLASTSRGFAIVGQGGGFNLSLNILKK